MKFLVYQESQHYKLGLKTRQGIVDIVTASKATGIKVPDTVDRFFHHGSGSLNNFKALTEADIGPEYIKDEAALTLGPAVPNPGKIICVGLNYRNHALETGLGIPQYPILFNKYNNALAASGEVIPITPYLSHIDYESELVVVMGKTAKDVGEDEALDYVLGYCNGNDLSERKLQTLTGQWMLGKTIDKFLPIGPYLVTADEVGDPQQLTIEGWLNGELRQVSHTSDMIFSVAQIISFASKYMTLHSGDILVTGTPEGVILGRDPRIWMKAGDEYTVEIDGLGRLSNRLVQA